jgi:rare lipoprotein A
VSASASTKRRSCRAAAVVIGTAAVIVPLQPVAAAERAWPVSSELCAPAASLVPDYAGCAASPSAAFVVRPEPRLGVVSYYANKFHGRRTASGARYDKQQLTAAHLTLPFGTLVRVTNPRNGRSVVVRINDRGPHIRGRVLDLSREAARVLGLISAGVARVAWEIVPPPQGGPATSGHTIAAAQ